MRAYEFIKEELNHDTLQKGFSHSIEIGDYKYMAGYSAPYRMLHIHVYDGKRMIAKTDFNVYGDSLESAMTEVEEDYRGQGIATNMYAYAKMLGNDIVPSDYQLDDGEKMWDAWNRSNQSQHILPKGYKVQQQMYESFDSSYPIEWEYSEYGDVDAFAKLADGTYLSIMFNREDNDDDEWVVEFHRNHSQEVSGEGDAQKIFATVLAAIKQFIQQKQPHRIIFSASKDNWAKQQQNSESRAKLYTRLIKRYANVWGYGEHDEDHGDHVTYELTRLSNKVNEDISDKILYHVTPAENVRNILRNGLVPGKGARSQSYNEQDDAIYCFGSKLEVEDALMNWLGNEFDDDQQLALLQINATHIPFSQTRHAEYEYTITTPVPPNVITLLDDNI
jgi:hypothetical protein